MSVYSRLTESWVQPDKVALSFGIDVRYGELRFRIAEREAQLAARGVAPGHVVAIQLPRSLELLETFLAVLKMGAVALPMNTAYTASETRFIIRDSGAVLHLCDGASQPLPTPKTLPSDVAVLCYTSGTTGRPKGAMLTHDNLAACIGGLHQAWQWSPQDVLVHALPLYHVHGLFVAQLGALWAGATTYLMRRFDAASTLRAMVDRRATIFMGVPTFYRRFLKLPESAVDLDLSAMRLFTSGSAPLPAEVHQAFRDRFGHRILERYGMTEVGIVLSNPVNGERRPGAVGFPLPGVLARVVDAETDDVLPPDGIGEIQIGGPSVFAGYLGLPDKTDQALTTDRWMRTGDLGLVDDDGYFHVVGRAKDLVISGGLNIYPREIETVLLQHPAVDEAAVVGIADPDWGEIVVALLVGDATQADALQSWTRQRLAGYKCPKQIRWAEALPRNAMAKVQKNRIREQW